jgi:hypothetical protein
MRLGVYAYARGLSGATPSHRPFFQPHSLALSRCRMASSFVTGRRASSSFVALYHDSYSVPLVMQTRFSGPTLMLPPLAIIPYRASASVRRRSSSAAIGTTRSTSDLSVGVPYAWLPNRKAFRVALYISAAY